MVDLTSQEQQNKDEMIDQVNKVLDEDDNVSPENKLETILLTMFAAIIMGILIFLFK